MGKALASEFQSLFQKLNLEALVLLEEKVGIHGIKSCDTRMGWTEGEMISFTCKVEKGGDFTLFEAMSNGLSEQDRAVSFGFLMGMDAGHLHLNPKMVIDIDGYSFFMFKISKHAERAEPV